MHQTHACLTTAFFLYSISSISALPVVTEITWIDADSSSTFATISNGSIFFWDELPLFVNLEAVVAGDVTSVVTEISGPLTSSNVEGSIPFSFLGDSSEGYNQVSRENFPEGIYTLKAVPFLGRRSSRQEGTMLEVVMTIVENVTTPPPVFDITTFPTLAPSPINTSLPSFMPTPEPSCCPPTSLAPTSAAPTTSAPSTLAPTTLAPTTLAPSNPKTPEPSNPDSPAPTSSAPTTLAPSTSPSSPAPSTLAPSTSPSSPAPSTLAPSPSPSSPAPSTLAPSSLAPSTFAPSTLAPTNYAPRPQPTPNDLPTQVQWELIYDQDDESNPVAQVRHESAFAEADGFFYLLGGRGTRTTNVFHPALMESPNSAWTDALALTQIHHFQPAVVEGDVYIINCFRGNFPNESPAIFVYAYRPATDELLEKTEIPPSRRRGSSATAVYDDVIYSVGGITNGHVSGTTTQFDRYDPLFDEWTVMPNEPSTPRDHAGAAIIGDALYVAGGRVSDWGNGDPGFDDAIPTVDVYDFTTATWSVLEQPLPTVRGGVAVVSYLGWLVVLGGESEFNVDAYDIVEAYDPDSGGWFSLAPLNKGRHGMTAFVYEDAIYIAGGSGNRGGTPELSSIEKLKIL